MTTALAGITLEELAARRGLTAAQARELVRPFLNAGIVAERDDGRFELVDRDVVFAIATEEKPAA